MGRYSPSLQIQVLVVVSVEGWFRWEIEQDSVCIAASFCEHIHTHSTAHLAPIYTIQIYLQIHYVMRRYQNSVRYFCFFFYFLFSFSLPLTLITFMLRIHISFDQGLLVFVFVCLFCWCRGVVVCVLFCFWNC